jgi:hypothetical protein
MKKLHLLSTVAVTLLLTAAAASAQTVKKDEAPAHAPAAQQKAPAEKVAPPMQRSERRAPATTGQAARDEKPAEHKAPLTTGQMAPKASESDKSQLKTQTMDKSGEQNRSTTGQGAAAGSARLSSEQRSKITTIFKHHRVAPAHLNVSVRVGTRVPESVHFYPLPLEVVDIYPEWRGYDYILVGDEILVIDPRTHEIVAILEA